MNPANENLQALEKTELPTETPPTPTFELSTEQKDLIDSVLELINTRETTDKSGAILLIGKAGVGKSTTIRALCDALDAADKNYVKLAPTGIAALNIGGQTIHRFIGGNISSRFFDADLVLVDEISMMRADLMDELNSALQRLALPEKMHLPFGGFPLLLVGDPGQLPPVMKKDDAECDYVRDNYLSPYFFSSHSYHQLHKANAIKVIELNKVFRQTDQRYPKLLNLIRSGDYEKPIAWLNKFRRTNKPKGVVLCSTNNDAAKINAEELSKINEQTVTYYAQINGNFSKNEYPVDEIINLKLGARIMVIKNIYRLIAGTGSDRSYDLELVNGDVGVITEIDKNGISFLCERTGKTHKVDISDGIWTKEDKKYDKESKRLTRDIVGSFVQLPVRLAYAITIHKSQGATIQELTLDVRRPLFATGQAYVALSRGVTLEKLWIVGQLRAKDIQVCPEVVAFLSNFNSGVGIKKGSIFDGTQLELIPEKKTSAFSELEKMFE